MNSEKIAEIIEKVFIYMNDKEQAVNAAKSVSDLKRIIKLHDGMFPKQPRVKIVSEENEEIGTIGVRDLVQLGSHDECWLCGDPIFADQLYVETHIKGGNRVNLKDEEGKMAHAGSFDSVFLLAHLRCAQKLDVMGTEPDQLGEMYPNWKDFTE